MCSASGWLGDLVFAFVVVRVCLVELLARLFWFVCVWWAGVAFWSSSGLLGGVVSPFALLRVCLVGLCPRLL